MPKRRLDDKWVAFGHYALTKITEWSAMRTCWHGKLPFGACSRHTDPMVGFHRRESVDHAGHGFGLSRSIRRIMSANSSCGMATSAIWNVT